MARFNALAKPDTEPSRRRAFGGLFPRAAQQPGQSKRSRLEIRLKRGRRRCLCLSHSGVKGLVNKPEDRSGAVKAERAARLWPYIIQTGPNDVVLISELADGSDVVTMGMAVAASTALSRVETVRAWTPGEFKGIAEKAARVASAYTPPGK